MIFFGKKDEKKPELPSLPGENHLPQLPQYPELNEKSEFPALPQMKKDQGNLGIGVIKSTIMPKVKKIDNPSDYQPSFKSEEKIDMDNLELSTNDERSEPIFVKIDKFHEALENFNKIKEKVLEIENELKKINEIKEQEEEELKEWENEIQSIKARMNVIDNSLFNRIGN